MATRIKEALPGKAKATSSPQTATAKLKGAADKISKAKVSTKPTPRVTPTDVSKQQSKKSASPATANKPAQTKTKPLDKKPLTPVQKTRVAAVTRSSSLPGKPVAGKSLKPVTKDEGKQRISTPIVNPRRSSIGVKSKNKKKEIGASGLATKEEEATSIIIHDKVEEDVNVYCVPEIEVELKDVECSYIAEAEEKKVQSLDDSGKGSIDTLATEVDQEPLISAKIGDEIDHVDSAVVISEDYPVSEKEIPLDIKTQEVENKDCVEERSSSKEELEHDTSETNSSNKVGNITDNSHMEAEKEEIKEAEVAAEQQKAALDKKDEAAVVSVADESKEIERPAVVSIADEPKETERPAVVSIAADEPKEIGRPAVGSIAADEPKEIERPAVVSICHESKEIKKPAVEKIKEILLLPKQQERIHGKIDSPVSNDVIEEAASKLRELRKNKVRALAGAFETVISLQEK